MGKLSMDSHRWRVVARNHRQKAGDDVKRAERVAEVLRMRRQGMPQRAIATELGVHLATVQRDLEAGLAAIPAEHVEGVRKLELERLDLWHERLESAAADAGMSPDELGRLAASYVRLSDRRAKLLGLDAPTKVQNLDDKPLEKWTMGELDARLAQLEGKPK